MAERKTIQEQALEAAVYLPVGFVLAARDEIPKLSAKGKAYVTNQVTMAKMVGNMAVTFGSREAEKRLHVAVKKLGVLWGEKPVGESTGDPITGGAPVDPDTSGASEAAQDSREEGSGSPDTGATPASGGSPGVSAMNGNGSAGTARRAVSSSGVDLAIPGYDSLSASQVVQRLAGLSAAELEAVAQYESATRDRRTIVNRATELLSPSPGDT